MLDSMGTLASKLVYKLDGQGDNRVVPEMLINGEIVYGQKMVQMLEMVLDK